MADGVQIQRIEYRPEPTLALFHGSNARVRGVMGPTGSGKSVGMIAELVIRAQEQAPDINRVRRSRWVVVRNTYPELRSTTIKTWEAWMPQARVIYDSPIRWRWQAFSVCPDQTHIDMEVLFLALDRPDDVRKLRSLDVTGAWLNEAQQMGKEILDWTINRCGRYPEKDRAPYTWDGVIMDANAMSDDHWWYHLAEVEKPEGYQFWIQPPALIKSPSGAWGINPACENLSHQPKGERYWLDQVSGKSDDWIRVNLCAEYGIISDGRAIFPEYEDRRHCTPELALYRGLPLRIGFDFGLTPAAAICQLTPKGQLRCIDEIVSNGMGIRQFLRDAVKPHLGTHYNGIPVRVIGDPAGNQRAQTDERTCFDELRAAGFDVRAAPTNSFSARREALAAFLLKRTPADTVGGPAEEGFRLAGKCAMIRKGLAGRYCYRRVRVSGEARYKDEPDKNEYSHPCEALGYVAVDIDAPQQAAARSARIGIGQPGGMVVTMAGDYPM